MPSPVSVTVISTSLSTVVAARVTVPPGRRVPQGVVEQIAQHLPDPIRVGRDRVGVLDVFDKRNALGGVAVGGDADGGVDEGAGVGARGRDGQPAFFGTGDGAHVLGKPSEPGSARP